MDQSQAATGDPAMGQPQAAIVVSAVDPSQAATSEYQKRKVGDQYNKYRNIIFDIILLYDRVQGLKHLNAQNVPRPTLGVIS